LSGGSPYIDFFPLKHTRENTMSTTPQQAAEFHITRSFDAPREQVWAAFSDAALLSRWFGPAGFPVRVAGLDFRPEGSFHYAIELPGGFAMWGKFRYLEIAAPERIVSINSFSDEEGNVTRNPMSESWPLELHNTMTLVEEGGKTILTQRSVAHNATAEEQLAFAAGIDALTAGFGGMFDQLAATLAAA
jgi:uncharacterized protein YndB with AHSA1/START domain